MNKKIRTTNYIRTKLIDWKHKELKSKGNVCALTGSKENLDLHHLQSFSDILNQAHKNLGLERHRYIHDYKPIDLHRLTKEVQRLHKGIPTIILEHSIHTQLHDIYGPHVSMEQIEEFKNKKIS